MAPSKRTLSIGILICPLVIVAATNASAGKASKHFRYTHAVAGSFAATVDPPGQDSTFQVFLADAEARPAVDTFLIGPDGKSATPDENGIVTVPQEWNGKEVSVRRSDDKRELAAVKLQNTEEKLLRISTVPSVTSNGGRGSQADRISTQVAQDAARRQKMLVESREILKRRHERKRFRWTFPESTFPVGAGAGGVSP